jgi:hypothetical protein
MILFQTDGANSDTGPQLVSQMKMLVQHLSVTCYAVPVSQDASIRRNAAKVAGGKVGGQPVYGNAKHVMNMSSYAELVDKTADIVESFSKAA